MLKGKGQVGNESHEPRAPEHLTCSSFPPVAEGYVICIGVARCSAVSVSLYGDKQYISCFLHENQFRTLKALGGIKFCFNINSKYAFLSSDYKIACSGTEPMGNIGTL